MISLIQRVSRAQVKVDTHIIGRIDYGLLALVAIEPGDGSPQVTRMLERLLSYRCFSDANDRMNLSLTHIDGGLLLVPQFTLAADTHKGTRPGFSTAATPEQGRIYFEQLLALAKQQYAHVESGRFGAHMEVELVNDGPVTFWLEAR